MKFLLERVQINYNIYNVSFDVRQRYIMGPKNYFRNNQSSTWNVKEFWSCSGRSVRLHFTGKSRSNAKEIDVMLDSSLP